MEITNFTEDGNNTTMQQLLCTTVGSNGLHSAKIFTSAFNIFASITAFVGNVLIIVALPKVSSLHPSSKLLFGCLACTDLLVGLIAQPLYVTRTILMCTKQPERRNVLILINTTTTLFGGVSMFTLTAISVDRLLALMLGLRYRHVVTLRRVRISVCVFWFCSATVAMMFFFSHRIAIGITGVGLVLSTVTSTFCYTKICIVLRQHQAQVQDSLHQGQPNGRRMPLNITRYKKTVSSALWVQMTLLACYLPYGIVVAIFSINGSVTPSLGIAWNVTLSLFFFNSTLNPFLYCWKIREVRQAVKNTIRKFNCFSS